jgi:hypothetical protein
MPNNDDVTFRLRGDNSSLDAANKKSAEVATATGRAIEKAAKQGAAAQQLAAKLAGEVVTEQSLKIIAAINNEAAASKDYRKALALTRQGHVDEAQGAQLTAAALQRLTAARLATAEASKVEAVAAESATSQTIAASAAIRSLEGNPGIRSIERFITTIPGMGAALQTIFPIIGALGLAGLFVNLGEKIYEFGSKAAKAATTTREAFAEIHDKNQINIDDLSITNDKLQDEIDKLGGHPGDGLKTSLDEARKMADSLLESLKADNKELTALLKENSVGIFGAAITGVAGTGKQSSELLADQKRLTQDIRAINAETLKAMAGVSDPAAQKAIQEKNTAAVNARIQAEIDNYKREAKRLRDEQSSSEANAEAVERSGNVAVNPIRNDAKLANVEGYISQLQDRQTVVSLDSSITSKRATVGALKQDSVGGNKAAEELYRKMEEERAKEEELGAKDETKRGLLSAQADAEFWQARIDAFTKGSAEFLSIEKKIAADEKKIAEESSAFRREMLKRAEGEPASVGNAALAKGQEGLTKWRSGDAHADDIKQDAQNESEAHAQRVSDQLQELDLAREAGRTKTQAAVAQEEAALHEMTYQAELLRLTEERAKAEKATYEDTVKREEVLARINARMDDLKGQHALQLNRDNAALNPGGSSFGVGFVDALDELAGATRQKAAEMKSFTLSTVNGVNGQIEKEIQGTAKKGDWRKLGGNIFGNASGVALKQFEGMGLKAFGFGSGKKKDGSSADSALYVQVVGGSGAAGLGKSLFGKDGPLMPKVSSMGSGDDDGSDDSDSSSGPQGGFAKLVAPLLHAFKIPGFADGGDPPGNSLVMVGERGPELMRTGPGGGHVTSHEDMMAAFSGGKGGDSYTIDARGTDAAQVEARIRHGMALARAQGSADAQRRVQETYLRRPR